MPRVKPVPAGLEGKVVHGRPLLPSSIVNLLAGCPVGTGNPEHCPLHAVRQLPLDEALEWVTQLSTDDKTFLLQYHRCCLAYSIDVERAAQKKASAKSPRRHASAPRATSRSA
jgi:hypothetical protein